LKRSSWNVDETEAALIAAGVDDRHYSIRGGRAKAKPLVEGSVVLGPAEGGGWTAWTWERGKLDVWEEFPDEDTACRWLFETLVRTQRNDDAVRQDGV
jgi:hypothetical protein